MKSILVVLFAIIVAAMGDLEPDNASHRGWSKKLDEKFGGNAAYDNWARPLVHGAYHELRFYGSGNLEEAARAVDQYSKIGTGEQHTNFLKRYRDSHEKEN